NNSGVATVTALTTSKSGVLEINDGGALPNTNNANSPNMILSGQSGGPTAEFWVNVNTAGNTAPASSQLVGQMTVNTATGNIIANAAANTTANSRVWNGVINVTSGSALTLASSNASRVA